MEHEIDRATPVCEAVRNLVISFMSVTVDMSHYYYCTNEHLFTFILSRLPKLTQSMRIQMELWNCLESSTEEEIFELRRWMNSLEMEQDIVRSLKINAGWWNVD